MGTAAKTTGLYPKAVLSAEKLQELIAQHNKGVRDDHTLMTSLDGEAFASIDNDYEAQLTAKEIRTEEELGGAIVEAATPAEKLDAQFLSEQLFRELVQQHNARVADVGTIVTKLNGDDGIAAADYASSAKKVSAYGEAGAAELFIGKGDGISGAVLDELVEQHAELTQDWHDIAAKLDADANTTASYESAITAKQVSEY